MIIYRDWACSWGLFPGLESNLGRWASSVREQMLNPLSQTNQRWAFLVKQKESERRMVGENKNWKPPFRKRVGCGFERCIRGKHINGMREKLLRLYYSLGIVCSFTVPESKGFEYFQTSLIMWNFSCVLTTILLWDLNMWVIASCISQTLV